MVKALDSNSTPSLQLRQVASLCRLSDRSLLKKRKHWCSATRTKCLTVPNLHKRLGINWKSASNWKVQVTLHRCLVTSSLETCLRVNCTSSLSWKHALRSASAIVVLSCLQTPQKTNLWRKSASCRTIHRLAVCLSSCLCLCTCNKRRSSIWSVQKRT